MYINNIFIIKEKIKRLLQITVLFITHRSKNIQFYIISTN